LPPAAHAVADVHGGHPSQIAEEVSLRVQVDAGVYATTRHVMHVSEARLHAPPLWCARGSGRGRRKR
jgi:hypothetical protein